MSKYLSFFLFLSLIFGISLAENDFYVGEKFRYSAYLNFIKVGKSFIKIQDSTEINSYPVYHIVSKTRTTGLIDKMVHIREHLESWVDCDSLYSRKFYKDVDEVKYEKTFEAIFNYDDSVAVLHNGKEKPISGPIMDWLSMIYYLRNVDLYKGQEVNYTFFDNNKFKDYSARVVEKKKIKVKAGEFYCWVVKPTEISKKKMKRKTEITIYMSIEKPKIPVKIKSKAKFGTLILELDKLE